MPTDRSDIPIWISLILDEWQAKGRPLGIDLRLRVARYIAMRGHIGFSASEWRARLAALICSNDEDQELFYDIFDSQWEKQLRLHNKATSTQESEDTELPKPPRPVSQTPTLDISREDQIHKEKFKEAPVSLATPKTQRKGPVHMELSFPPNPTRYWNTRGVDLAVRPLLEKEWTPIQEWDAIRSIIATIKAGGVPKLVHKRRKIAPRYLFLIEQQSRYDHLAGLYRDLVVELRGRDLDVEWFFYDTMPHRCWYDRLDSSTHTFIQRIFSEYEDYKLIIIGEPRGLLELPNIQASNLLLDMVDHFPSVALLNTKLTVAWGLEENALNQVIPVVPASAEGLSSLVKQWSAADLLTPSYWKLEQNEPSVPDLYFDDEESKAKVISDLKVYLGRAGFSWLCATAVYPELHYELSSLLNDESIAPNPQLSEMDQNAVWFRALYRISRLEWFRHGRIPVDIRKELRDWLPEKQAAEVRRQLLEVLHLDENRPPVDSYAAANYEFVTAWLDFEKTSMEQSSEEAKETVRASFQSRVANMSAANVGDPLGKIYLRELHEGPEEENAVKILWVDDNPENVTGIMEYWTENVGIKFHLATSTEQAMVQLNYNRYQIILSDYSRSQEPRAAYNLLASTQAAEISTPIIIFTSKRTEAREQNNLIEAGAAAVASEINELYDEIRSHLGLVEVTAEEEIETQETQQTYQSNAEAEEQVEVEEAGAEEEEMEDDDISFDEMRERIKQGKLGFVFKALENRVLPKTQAFIQLQLIRDAWSEIQELRAETPSSSNENWNSYFQEAGFNDQLNEIIDELEKGEAQVETNKSSSEEQPTAIDEIRQLIINVQVKEAINATQGLINQNHDLYNEITLVAYRYNDLQQKQLENTISLEEGELESNRIVYRLLEIVNQLEEGKIQVKPNELSLKDQSLAIREVQELVANGKTAKAISAAQRLISRDQELFNEITLVAYRYNDLRQKELEGTVTADEPSFELNRIHRDILKILNQVQRTRTIGRNQEKNKKENNSLTLNEVLNRTKNYIGKARIEKAFDLLDSAIREDSENRNIFLLLKRRWNTNERDMLRGIISEKDFDLRLNKITHDLLELTNSLQEEDIRPDFITSDDEKNQEPTPPPNEGFFNILIIPASPDHPAKLQQDRELAHIRNSLGQIGNTERFRIWTYRDISTDKLMGILLDHRPVIVHFSGSGQYKDRVIEETKIRESSSQNKITFLDEEGSNPQQVTPDQILDVFLRAQKSLDNKIKAVVFNACISQEIAEAISKEVEFVLGSDWGVGDEAATIFIESFYERIAIDLIKSGESDIPSAFDTGLTDALVSGETVRSFKFFEKGGEIRLK